MPKLKCFETIIIFNVLLLPIPDEKKKEHNSFMTNFYAVLSSTSILVTYEKKRKGTYHEFTTDFIESLDSIRCSAT